VGVETHHLSQTSDMSLRTLCYVTRLRRTQPPKSVAREATLHSIFVLSAVSHCSSYSTLSMWLRTPNQTQPKPNQPNPPTRHSPPLRLSLDWTRITARFLGLE